MRNKRGESHDSSDYFQEDVSRPWHREDSRIPTSKRELRVLGDQGRESSKNRLPDQRDLHIDSPQKSAEASLKYPAEY